MDDEKKDDGKTDIEKIEELKERSTKELLHIKSVFPFDIFPKEIIVDEVKVTIVDNQLFFKKYFPILIKDIKTVTLTYNLFFATIIIEIPNYDTNPGPVSHLKIDEAKYAHKVIVGLTALSKEKVDKSLSAVPPEGRPEVLEELGQTSSPTNESKPHKPEELEKEEEQK